MTMSLSRVLLYALMLIFAFFCMLPIYSAVNIALKSGEELVKGPATLVMRPTFMSFVKAFKLINKNLVNSIKFTVPATLISTILGSMSGYALSKIRFRGAGVLSFVIILALYIPPISIMIPLVSFMRHLGLYNTIYGLILTHTAYGMPVTTLLFRNYYTEIPDEIVESAEIDGCGLFDIYRLILLPLSIPGFIVVLIFQFTNIWNDFFFGLVLTMGAENQPVTVAVANLEGTTFVARNIHMAGALIAAIPVLLIYVLLTKWIVRGLLQGAIKR